MSARPEEVLRALADPERLAVMGLIAREDRTLGDLSRLLDLDEARVRRHLARLTRVGLIAVADDRRTYRLLGETLRAAARQVGPSRDPGVALGAANEQEEAVLRQYFRAGRLTEIPGKRAKRLIVLERLSLEFEVGIRYPERDVNAALERFHADYASLRRYLVDEGFLSRGKGEYWRSGGRVDLSS